MEHATQFTAPAGRALISSIFIMSGLSKLANYGATASYMESAGVPGLLLPLVIFTEVVFGLLVIIGWKARFAAFALAGFSILSALLFHGNFSDQAQMTSFMKNIAIAGGFLFLVASGAGAWSLDGRRTR